MLRFLSIGVVVCLVSAAAAGVVYLVKENQELNDELAVANAKVIVLKARKEATDRALIAQSRLEKEINVHRQQIDKAVEGACAYDGDERIEHLLRVLHEDAAARCDRASANTNGAVSGTSGK